MREYITKTNFDYLIKPTRPEDFYTLGFLWADGYLYNKNGKTRVSIDIQESDAEVLKDLFLSCGTWYVNTQYRINKKPLVTFGTTNKFLLKYLTDYDYDKKSFISPDKILYSIPTQYHHYWFMGYFDGDGCFYHHKKRWLFQTSICSTYDQDWSAIERIYKKLNINYVIKRRIQHEKSRHSVIRTSGRDSYFKIGQYIYQDRMIGLPRKFEKWKLVLSKIKENTKL